jgi:uncharacterized cupredoxin-like copper-binding protein
MRRSAVARLVPVALAIVGPTAMGSSTILAETAGRVDWSKLESVTVTMVNYRFVPDHLIFRRSVPYRLHLRNDGTEIHDFSAPQFFQAVELENPEVLNPYGDRVVVAPHQEKDVYFTATRPGTYALRCADHDWAGMKGEITVE